MPSGEATVIRATLVMEIQGTAIRVRVQAVRVSPVVGATIRSQVLPRVTSIRHLRVVIIRVARTTING